MRHGNMKQRMVSGADALSTRITHLTFTKEGLVLYVITVGDILFWDTSRCLNFVQI